MWRWRIGLLVACVVAFATIVAGKGMLVLIGLPALAAAGTNLWSARGSGPP
jgi:hypothetical protein